MVASLGRARSVTAAPAAPEARPPDVPATASGGCPGCGRRLGVWARLGRGGFCGSCGPEQKERVEHRRGLFLGALTAIEFETELSPRQRQIIAETAPDSVGAAWHRRSSTSAVRFLLDEAVRDDLVTEAEDRRIHEIGRLVNVSPEALLDHDPDLVDRFVLGRARDGRLPVAPAAPLSLRRREVCHYKVKADLLDSLALSSQTTGDGLWVATDGPFEHVHRALRAKVPSRSRTMDAGILAVTDRRLIFRGRQHLEVPFDDLVGFTLFRDGLGMRIRRLPADPVFRLRSPHLVAGLAVAAREKRRLLAKG